MSQTSLDPPIDIKFLAAESVICSDRSVAYLGPFGRTTGRIVVTRYRLVFIVDDASQKFHRIWTIDVPLGQISKVEKYGGKSTSSREDGYGFIVYCKDYRSYKFSSSPLATGRKTICDAINRYAFPLTNSLPIFAFIHAAESPAPLKDGWKIYNPLKEFERQGVRESKQWVILETLNQNYKFSDTYPKLFRSRQRIPVLSWLNKQTGASITRCSQPMTGMTGRRSAEDESHLTNIMLANANLNRAKGGGYEENYENASLIFLDIHNIHVIRESLKKLVLALIPRVDEKSYYKTLDESKWLNHIQAILEGSVKIVHNVENSKQSVLVHCSDGWDRTAQLTSLSMLQIDEYYRTLEGFIVLIEKEWCSFGHKFGQRIGHGEDRPTDSERAPIFVQFFDCLWQIMQQNATRFEFTEQLLIVIIDEMYACKYGTFLYNTEKIRHADNKCAEKTFSLWSYVMENKKRFLNPLYDKYSSSGPLQVNPSFCRLQVWTNYYARSNPHVVTPKDEGIQQINNRQSVCKSQFLEEIQQFDEFSKNLAA
ncbi:unnamed protein product [Caenorhabditis angaria]|uniref:Phosphatidylinositol-3-phosphatase n=1 Tax=Caenorhabditis angaria TaxID=860376 RepID=A0A9P1I858_9PELO|nr:unnamed protein product [Caenorhabditis angaria]